MNSEDENEIQVAPTSPPTVTNLEDLDISMEVMPSEIEIELELESESDVVFEPFLPRYANDDLYCRVSIPLNNHILMKLIRNKDDNPPTYDLFLERADQLYLLHAKKKLGSQYYEIYSDEKADKYLGKVYSNFFGTEFTICDDKNLDIAVVLYKQNILGFKGPRCMTIILPALLKDGKRYRDSKRLMEHFKVDSKKIVVLQNKTPLWNAETNSYVLNFNGRVTVASVKNFQVTPKEDLDYILLQFGRIETNQFTLDCKYPISILQAFGIALTSFESKLACE